MVYSGALGGGKRGVVRNESNEMLVVKEGKGKGKFMEW